MDKITTLFECGLVLDSAQLNNLAESINGIIDYIHEKEGIWENGSGSSQEVNLNTPLQQINQASLGLPEDSNMTIVSSPNSGWTWKKVINDTTNVKSFSQATLFKWWEESPTKPNQTLTASDYISGQYLLNWSKVILNLPLQGYSLWMILRTLITNIDGSYTWEENTDWSTPARISGKSGDVGADGNSIEYIYSQKSEATTFDDLTKPSNINVGEISPVGVANGESTNKLANGWVPNGWTNHPNGVNTNMPFEYMSLRLKLGGYDESWGEFSNPIIWSHYGERGVDGDGVEYAFIRTQTKVVPKIINESSSDSNSNTYVDDDYLPTVQAFGTIIEKNGSSSDSNIIGECTDKPKGTNETWKYEWVIKRTKGNPIHGERVWNKYPNNSEMSLWANYSEDGYSLDLSNEMDSVITNESGNPLIEQTVSTEVYMNRGGVPLNNVTYNFYRNGIAYDGSNNGVTINLRNGNVSITYATNAVINNKDIITIEAPSGSVTLSKDLTINASSNDIYNVVPSVNQINVSRNNNDEFDPSIVTIYCGYRKKDISGNVTTVSNIGNNLIDNKYKIYYRREIRAEQTVNGLTYNLSSFESYIQYTGNILLNVSIYKSIEFIICENLESSIIDKELIPVIADGKKGLRGYQGATPRSREWDPDPNLIWYEGAEGDPFIDLCIIKDNQGNIQSFLCKQTIESGDTRENRNNKYNPLDGTLKLTHWATPDANYQFLATDFLLSKSILTESGKFDGLNVNYLTVGKDSRVGGFIYNEPRKIKKSEIVNCVNPLDYGILDYELSQAATGDVAAAAYVTKNILFPNCGSSIILEDAGELTHLADENLFDLCYHLEGQNYVENTWPNNRINISLPFYAPFSGYHHNTNVTLNAIPYENVVNTIEKNITDWDISGASADEYLVEQIKNGYATAFNYLGASFTIQNRLQDHMNVVIYGVAGILEQAIRNLSNFTYAYYLEYEPWQRGTIFWQATDNYIQPPPGLSLTPYIFDNELPLSLTEMRRLIESTHLLFIGPWTRLPRAGQPSAITRIGIEKKIDLTAAILAKNSLQGENGLGGFKKVDASNELEIDSLTWPADERDVPFRLPGVSAANPAGCFVRLVCTYEDGMYFWRIAEFGQNPLPEEPSNLS